jgi:hypothetical protein
MSQISRISGGILKNNLLRDGIDLTFRNKINDEDILYLDVNAKRISINTIGSQDLNVDNSGTVKTINLVGNTAKVANIKIGVDGNDIISSEIGNIVLTPNQTDPLILADQLRAGNTNLKDTTVSNYTTNGSIELRPNGTGLTIMDSSSKVNGNLTVTGNIDIAGDLSKQGNIIVGDSILDTVVIGADFSQSIIPGDDLSYDLGTSTKRWRRVFTDNNDQIGSLSYTSFTVSDQLQVDGLTRQIYSLQSNDDLKLSPDTGITDIEAIRIEENTITNLIEDSVLTIASTGIGYVRFMGTNGTVIPAGTTAERPANPEVGDTRWNTSVGRLECWDGTTYNVATGPGATIGEVEMTDLQFVYAVMLG